MIVLPKHRSAAAFLSTFFAVAKQQTHSEKEEEDWSGHNGRRDGSE